MKEGDKILNRDVRVARNVLNTAFKCCGSLILVFKLLLLIIKGKEVFEDNLVIHFVNPCIMISLGVVVGMSQRLSIFYQKLCVILAGELIIQIFKSLSAMITHNEILLMNSVLIMLIFQAHIVGSMFWMMVLAMKSLYQFYISKLIWYQLEPNLQPWWTVIAFTFNLIFLGVYYHFRNLDLKRAIEQRSKLEQKDRTLKNIIQALPDGVLVLDLDFKPKLFNSLIIEMLDCEHEDLLDTLKNLKYNQQRRLLQVENLDNSVFFDLQACMSYPVGISDTLGSVSVNQKQLNIQIKKSLWNDHQALIVIFHNATQMVQIQKAFAQISCKQTILKFISHQVKTPNVAISGCAQDLLFQLRDHQQNHQVIYNLQIIKASSRLMLFMIGDIIDFTGFLSGNFSLNKTWFDVKEVVSKIGLLIKHQCAKKKIDYQIRIDPNFQQNIYTDKNRLSQLLVNLLNNSLKYTFIGKIQLIVLKLNESSLKFTVQDSGIGIPPDRLLHITQTMNSPLGKGDMKTGLAISNLIAQSLGQVSLSIQSSGLGTKIWGFVSTQPEGCQNLDLYIEGDSSELVEQSKSQEVIVKKPRVREVNRAAKLLIVDDNAFNRIALCSILKRQGVATLEAADGTQAIQIIHDLDQKRNPIELVFMDIDMPIMDGWTATLKLKEMHQNEEIRFFPSVVAYSAFDSDDEVRRSYHVGMVYHLSKPAPIDVILELLRRFHILNHQINDGDVRWE